MDANPKILTWEISGVGGGGMKTFCV